jgi:5S rRNA maturation endonuclease (ribonuclease M5)
MLSPLERLEEVMRVLDEIEDLSADTLVVVEGRKDVEALRRLGIDRNVVPLGRGRTIVAFCEDLAKDHGRVVLLTDWDRKGGHLARALKEALETNGVKVLDGPRTQLVILSKKEIKDVEGLPAFVAGLKVAAGRP